jgi:pyruvate/2-oxoglutarate dehydrogenase complex dihydrolipoamide dehydrogenase (E3) component
MKQITCDICIIGAGSGGLTVASAAAQLGRKTVLIERGKMGGDCLNYGCVPSKALIAAARHAHGFRSAADFGIAPSEPAIDFPKVIAHVHRTIAAIEPDDSQERFEKLGCTVLRHSAHFIDGSTVKAGDLLIKARRFVIAAGSSPAIPAIRGLDEIAYFTSDTIFENKILPGHLIIIGAGAVGLELAQAFRRLGSQVTVLEAMSPLSNHDPELTQIVLAALEHEAVNIISPCKIVTIRKLTCAIGLTIEAGGNTREIKGTHILLAAGRRPNVENLGLAAAGIGFSERGIEVNADLKTSNPRVYAIGDIIGGLQFTHVAGHQAGLVIRNALFRQPIRYIRAAMPGVVYTDPECAEVGLNEAEAAASGLVPKVLRWPLSRSDRARIERRTEGLLKIVLDPKSRVIGAGIVGLNAGELILPWTQMVAERQKIGSMAGVVIPYPTLSDASRRVALANYETLASNPWVRRVIDVVTSFGG